MCIPDLQALEQSIDVLFVALPHERGRLCTPQLQALERTIAAVFAEFSQHHT